MNIGKIVKIVVKPDQFPIRLPKPQETPQEKPIPCPEWPVQAPIPIEPERVSNG